MRWLWGLLASLVVVGACSSSDDATDPAANPDADGGSSGGTSSGGGGGDDDDTQPPIPTDPAVAFVGRFLVDGDARTVSWPGSRIIAKFDGTSVSVKLEETPLDEGPSVFDVKLDDKVTTLALNEGEQTYELGKDLAAGTHQVELYRRTEGRVGRTVFKGFDFGSGKLLPPPRPSARRIEILGDSSAAGYGVECDNPDDSFTSATENFEKAWPTKIGQMLDADVIGTIYAGKGVVQNNDRSDKDLFPAIFLRTASEEADPPWDFAKLPVDAVVIMLGGNDYDQPNPGENDEPSLSKFKSGYAKLLDTVREKYPKALIVSVLSPTQNDDYPEGFDARTNQQKAFSEVIADRKAAGDAAAIFVDVSRASEDETTACEFHPNEGLHTRIATTVAAEVKKAKNW